MPTTDSEMCYWRCPNCGQVHFGDHPPDLCAFCRDFTTWQLIAGQAPSPPAPDDAPPSPLSPDKDEDEQDKRDPRQRRLFD